MDPIYISSSESDADDWDLEGDMEPETSSRSKTGSLTHSNDHPLHAVPTNGPYFKGYNGVQVPRFLLNGYKRPQIQIKPSSSRGFGSYATSSSQPVNNWSLPPHLQACLEEPTSSSRTADTLENVRSRMKRKTHLDAFYPRAFKLESGTDYNTLDDESDEEVIMYEKVGSTRISLESGYKKVKSEVSSPPFRSVSAAQYANSGSAKVESTGLPPSFGSTAQPVNLGNHAQRGVAAEKQGERNERLVYQAALQDLNQPRVEATLPDGLLSVSLLKHQRIALAWLLPKERASLNCCGGFLADDQGLGKTISMIALIQMQRHLESKTKVEDEQKKTTESLNLDDDDDDFDDVKVTTDPKRLKEPQDIRTTRPAAGTLVVCPASVLRQWASELKNKVADEFELSILIYHGSNRTKDPVELASYDVVLTTYALVGNEVPKLPLADEADDDKEWYELSSSFKPKKKKKDKKEKSASEIESESGTLAKVGWLRVILDEAQIIKNHRTKVARACCGLRAKRRWCLSGTPIQNTIEDLFSYFRFLRYDPYAEYKAFCSAIKGPISRDKSHGYKKLQAVLRAIMLRRTKGTIIDGEPILNLPPKTINMASFEFSTTERSFYDNLEQKSRSQFKKYADAGTVNQNYASILLMLLRLRQACGHPQLTVGTDSKSKGSVETAMKFPQDVLLTFLNRLDTSAPICHLCSEPPEDAVISSRCRHIFCYPCISEYLTGDDNTCPAPECHKRLGIDFMFSKSTLVRCIKSDNHSSTPSDDGGFKDCISTKVKAAIKHLKTTCKPQKNTPSCSDCVETEEPPIKAIVFSQWTKMLDIFEVSLRNSGLEYRRLDGTMTLGLRDANVSDFNTDPKVSVILMSLKAGNLGLNMIAATHVVLLDLWWNPTTEDQAIDRAHRIGQTRPVTVTRMTIKNTVEDRILALQEKKRIMVASAFGEEYGGGEATRLTVDDLKYLFMY